MANETHNLRIGIDASQAKRGASAYTAAIDKIAKATRDFQKMSADMGKNLSKTGSFSAVARDLAKLNSLRLNPSLAKNMQALSASLTNFRGPSRTSVTNTNQLFRALATARINQQLTRNLTGFTTAMSGFRGPSRTAVANTRGFFAALSTARLTPGIAANLSAISGAMSNFRGMGAASARNFQTFVTAVNSLRIPPGIGHLGAALSGLSSRFGSGSAAAIRFGGSVNGIPWGRASAGAVQLTGNLRGLENAMSLSYQMGSQLRTLFGALTVSGFTSAVIEATTSSDRLATVMTAIGLNAEESAQQMAFAEGVADKYGISLLEVQKNYGKFAAAASESNMTLEQSDFIFESLAANMRLFGLSNTEQALAIKAVTQSLSKGSIQAEEFKNQFGDQMPAAMTVLKKVMQDLTGDMNVDPMEMMKKGQIGADTWVLIFEEMNRSFGKGFEGAAALAIASMQRLQNEWTKFLKLVGNAGVMQAIGDVSKQLTEILATDEFRQFGQEIGEGLASAIRKAGNAAAFLLTHIREVTKVIAGLLALKAVGTIVQMGSAFSLIGAAVTGTASKIGGFISLFGKIGGPLRMMGMLGAAVGVVGGAFGIMAVGAAAALALTWDNTVKLGEATTTVGSMAMVAFTDFGNWAQWAGQAATEAFWKAMEVAQEWFNGLNQQLTGGKATWVDWAKAIIGVIVLVGSVAGKVFNLMWKTLIDGGWAAVQAVKGIGDSIGSAFQSVGAAIRLDFSEAHRLATLSDQQLNDAATGFGAAIGGGFMNVATLLDETRAETEAYLNGTDWASMGIDAGVEFASGWVQSLADRGMANDLAAPKPEKATWEDIAPPSHEGLNFLLNADEDAEKAAKAYGTIANNAKAAAEALKDFNADQAALNALLASGKISLDQYNQALEYYRGKLEETTDPYAAMVRSMKLEAEAMRGNSREQRINADFLARRNELLDKGVVLTAAQTEQLKQMTTELDKLQNPSPLQAWIDGMQDFGEAVETAGVKAMEGLSDSIADLIVDGKADWQSLFKSITKDLIKLSLNELWKPLFGGGKDAAIDKFAETDSIMGMSQAVANGINMAGGGMGAAGSLLGNDTGTGVGSWGDFQSIFGKPNTAASTANGFTSALGGDPVSSFMGGTSSSSPAVAAATSLATGSAAPLTQATRALQGATTTMASTGSAVETGITSLNDNFSSLFGAGAGIPGMSAPNLPMTNKLSAASMAGGNQSIMDLLAPGKAASHANGLDPEFARRIEAMFNAPDAPPGLEIFSGYRSVEHQQQLWNDALRKYGSPEAARKWVAPPGKSSHNSGRAIDVGQNGSTFSGMDPAAQQWLHENAGQYGLKFPLSNEGWHMEMQETRGGAPFTGALPGAGSYSQAGAPPSPMLPAQGMYGQMQYGSAGLMQPSMAGVGGGALPGGLPGGLGSSFANVGGMPGAMGGGMGLEGLGDQVKAQLTPAFQEVATAVPGQFGPSFTQLGQELPQKLVPQGDTLATQLASAAQPGNLQAAQDNSQKYQEANTQAANDFAMKMQQAGGAGGGIMGGMGGGMGGGLGMLGGIFGSFFAVGGTVGSSGGSRRSMSTLMGDPDAEPIVAHRGELITPAHEVNRMRRMGDDAMLLDNAAIRDSNRRNGHATEDGGIGDGTSVRQPTPRPIVNFNITTPNADSFRASQSQINAKAGAAAYRDAARNR